MPNHLANLQIRSIPNGKRKHFARFWLGASNSKVRTAGFIRKPINSVCPKRLGVEPHKYIPLPDGKYVTVKAPDGKHAIRFETDKGRVITYYSGRFPEVEYVEHCL